MTCWRRLVSWHEAGWRQPHERLLAESHAACLLDLSAALVDSTHLCAPKGLPGAEVVVDRRKPDFKHDLITAPRGVRSPP